MGNCNRLISIKKVLSCVSLGIMLTACGGGGGSDNNNNLGGNNNFTGGGSPGIATGIYLVAQPGNNQPSISIPVWNNSNNPVPLSVPNEQVGLLKITSGSCGSTLASGQVCSITATLSDNSNNITSTTQAESIPVTINGETYISTVNIVTLSQPLTTAQLYVPSAPLIAYPGQSVYTSLTFVNSSKQLANAAASIESVQGGGSWQFTDCSASQPKQSCSIIVQYTASTTSSINGNNTAAVFVKGGASNGIYALTSNSQGISSLSVNPPSIDLNSAESEQTVILTNSGNIPITNLSTTPNTSSTCTQALPLSPFNKGSCSLTIKRSDYKDSSTLTINYGDFVNENRGSIPIAVNTSSLVAKTSTLNFATFINSSQTESVEIENKGNTTLTLLQNITTPNKLSKHGNFSLKCTSYTLTPESSITCQLTFLAQKATSSPISGNITFNTSQASVTASIPVEISVSNTSDVYPSPSTLYLAAIGNNPESATVSIVNNSNVTINNLSFTSPAMESGGSITVSSNNCSSIQANQSCPVTVTYTPSITESFASGTAPLTYNYSVGSYSYSGTMNINWQYTVNGPSITCTKTTISTSYYYGDPNANAGANITCNNNGQDAATISWESNTSIALQNPKSGFKDNTQLSKSYSLNGNNGSYSGTITANPNADNTTYEINNLQVHYVGVLTGQSGNVPVIDDSNPASSSISYSTTPWITAQLSNCNLLKCSIIVSNNSSDEANLEPINSTSHMKVANDCTSVTANSSCTINFSVITRSFANLYHGESNNITINPANGNPNQPIAQNFSYITSETLYLGASGAGGSGESTALVYYQPFISDSLLTYCYTGKVQFSTGCASDQYNNSISSLLFDNQSGHLYIGTNYDGTSGGIIFKVKNLRNKDGGDYLGSPGGACTPTQPCSSITSMALDNTNNLMAGTPSTFGRYSESHDESYKAWTSLPTSQGGGIVASLPIESAGIIAQSGLDYFGLNSAYTDWLASPLLGTFGFNGLFTTGESSIFTLNSPFITAFNFNASNEIVNSGGNVITGIESSDIIMYMASVNGALIATTGTNAVNANHLYYLANAAAGGEFHEIKLKFGNGEYIQSLALDAKANLYLTTNLGSLAYFENIGTSNAPNYANQANSYIYFKNAGSISPLTVGYNTTWNLTPKH